MQSSPMMNSENIFNMAVTDFEAAALVVFHYQYEHNGFYRKYCDMLNTNPAHVNRLTDIPFLPISFYKTEPIKTGTWEAALIFESSGTTGDTPSRHFVKDALLYKNALLTGFEKFYGHPSDYAIIALLPSYLERKNASLVYMAKTLMEDSAHPANSFYLNEWGKLHDVMAKLESERQKTLIIGVTFALLDFAAAYPMSLQHAIVMETGGMKGRKEEMTRVKVHEILKKQWQLSAVHSEYGMTELLSQAYSTGEGIFECIDTMRVMIREVDDPLEVSNHGRGCLNIIDLANIHSCCFIATEDMGIVDEDGRFEVTGRMDNSALRGCSLMAV